MGDENNEQSPDPLAGWGNRLTDLESRLADARSMGGDERLERQASRGEMNARQRIDALLDPGSFQELGSLVGAISEEAPADAFPAGLGRIHGRPVLVGAEDFTVKGGSIGLGAADKRYRLTQLARSEKVPLIFILQGAGHRITNALKGHGRAPNDLQGLVEGKQSKSVEAVSAAPVGRFRPQDGAQAHGPADQPTRTRQTQPQTVWSVLR